MKTILTPPEKALTLNDNRVMDYLTGINPYNETKLPDAVANPQSTFDAGEMMKRDREEMTRAGDFQFVLATVTHPQDLISRSVSLLMHL